MGRRAFQPTDEQRQQVSEWRHARVAVAEIAQRLGITAVTLRKHFPTEGPTASGMPLLDGTRFDPAPPTPKPPPPAVDPDPPSFRPTADQRKTVEILAAVRLPVEEIAARVNVTVPELEQHFIEELTRGPGKRNADVVLAVYRSAIGGNNSAQRLWLAITSLETDKEREAEPTGKKIAAALAAKTAGIGTEWGDDLAAPGLRLVKS